MLLFTERIATALFGPISSTSLTAKDTARQTSESGARKCVLVASRNQLPGST